MTHTVAHFSILLVYLVIRTEHILHHVYLYTCTLVEFVVAVLRKLPIFCHRQAEVKHKVISHPSFRDVHALHDNLQKA